MTTILLQQSPSVWPLYFTHAIYFFNFQKHFLLSSIDSQHDAALSQQKLLDCYADYVKVHPKINAEKTHKLH